MTMQHTYPDKLSELSVNILLTKASPGCALQPQVLHGQGTGVEANSKAEVDRLEWSLLIVVQQQEIACTKTSLQS